MTEAAFLDVAQFVRVSRAAAVEAGRIIRQVFEGTWSVRVAECGDSYTQADSVDVSCVFYW